MLQNLINAMKTHITALEAAVAAGTVEAGEELDRLRAEIIVQLVKLEGLLRNL